MAEHKVPQDVEAEDKLLGPFSFRQFIYLMIALAGIAMAYFLGQMAMFLAIIPVPVVIVFLILALPLRKDQPMETYVGALIHFYFTPSRRLWSPDGQDVLVEITNPPIDSVLFTKEVGGAEAAQRLSFLAELEDTQGWSTRGVTGSMVNTTNLVDDFANAAFDAPDILDPSDSAVQDIDSRIISTEQQRREKILSQFNNSASSPAVITPTGTPNQPTSLQPQPQTTQPTNNIDEHAIAAALRQSSAQTKSTFQQGVVQPIGVARQVKPAATQPASQPTTQPNTNITSPFLPTNKPAPQAETKNTEPAKIETISTTINTVSAPPRTNLEQNTSTATEEVIGHNGESDSSEIEVRLH